MLHVRVANKVRLSSSRISGCCSLGVSHVLTKQGKETTTVLCPEILRPQRFPFPKEVRSSVRQRNRLNAALNTVRSNMTLLFRHPDLNMVIYCSCSKVPNHEAFKIHRCAFLLPACRITSWCWQFWLLKSPFTAIRSTIEAETNWPRQCPKLYFMTSQDYT